MDQCQFDFICLPTTSTFWLFNMNHLINKPHLFHQQPKSLEAILEGIKSPLTRVAKSGDLQRTMSQY